MVNQNQRWSVSTAAILLAVPCCQGFLLETEFRQLERCTEHGLAVASSKAHLDALPSSVPTTKQSITIPSCFRGVTVYDYPSPLHSIHVMSILSDQEAARCLELATAYASVTGCWEQPDQLRHAAYSTCDFAVEECEEMQNYLNFIEFDKRMWEHLNTLFGIGFEVMSYLDFFCAHYQSNEEGQATKTMDRLQSHRDGSLLSFTITLNDPEEFEGGGTFFDALRDVKPTAVLLNGGVVRPLRAGDGVLHSGKILHGADVVRSGKRTVLVGFVDVSDYIKRQGTLTAACRNWGRMDVATFRWKRQQAMTAGEKKGWLLNYAKCLPRGKDQSFLRGVCPAFKSVERRADQEYQRRKKLEAEDLFLRSILLPEGELNEQYTLEADISIL